MSKSLLFFTFYLALPFLVVSLLSPVQVRINHRINSIKPERLKNKFFQNDITSAKFSMVKHTSLQAGRSISLDTALLAGGKSELQKLGFVMLFITLIACQLLRSSRIERSNNTRKSTESREDSGFNMDSLQESLRSFLKRFQSAIKALYSKALSSAEAIKEAVTSSLGLNRGQNIQLDDWNICKFCQKESLYGGRYIRYQFELESAASKIPLYIGQEIVMCLTDSKERILKENFFPISSSSVRGSFEVLARSNTGVGSYDKFVRSLDSLEQDDEIGFKGGSYRLNYQGKDDPIKYVTVVSAGLGIAPSLQILNGILSDRDSTVEDMELLWMNGDNKDFVCEKDIIALEKKHDKKLFVTRVNENRLFEKDLTQMDDVLGALSPYEPNRIAVLCGSDEIILKMKELLLEVGYRSDSILSIST